MKFGKSKLLLLPLILTSAVIPFISSCAHVSPYQNLSPGDTISALTEKNSSFLRADVINQCDQYGFSTITNTDLADFIDSASVISQFDMPTLLYWELAWGMCQFNKGGAEFHQDASASWKTFFVEVSEKTAEIETTGTTTLFINNTTLDINTPYYFAYEQDSSSHQVLSVLKNNSGETLLTWNSRFFQSTTVVSDSI